MSRLRTRTGRRAAAGLALTLLVALPVAAFFAAPNARADTSPAANLAGLNVNANGTGIQFIPLVKGLVPAGDIATGNFFQISVPYAASSSQTGPSNSATATPVYPGPVAASLSGGLTTLGFPAQLAKLFTDPVLAQAASPPQPGMGPSASYSPPGGSVTGVGTANAHASDGGATAQANLSNTPVANVVTIGSTTSSSSTTVTANTVSGTAHADLTNIQILGGLVKIASISSDSTASSDGNRGTEQSALKIGAVTVAGQPAYIDADGLHLQKTSNDLGGLAGILNQTLTALQVAGISISTIQPVDTVQAAAASVDSGALQIHFMDSDIPNPQGDVPVSAAGVDIDLGLTHADAQATALPPIPPFAGSPGPTSTPPSTSFTGPVSTGSSSGTGGSSTIIQTSNSSGGGDQGPSTAPLPQNSGGSQGAVLPATFIGMPTRMAWVVISVLLSIVASGPLLGYANWQLLRGRKS